MGILFQHKLEEGEYLVSSSITTDYGVGETLEEAVNDFLQMLAGDYEFLVFNKDSLAPRLLKELDKMTSFFSGEELLSREE